MNMDMDTDINMNMNTDTDCIQSGVQTAKQIQRMNN